MPPAMREPRTSPNHETEEDAERQEQQGRGNEEEGPACYSCRKRKAKCSREQPCSQCDKIGADCVYDDKKIKPGMRLGAIQALTQRLTALENMFMGQSLLLQPLLNPPNAKPFTPDSVVGDASIDSQIANLKNIYAQAASEFERDPSKPRSSILNQAPPERPTKRQRLVNVDATNGDEFEELDSLPPADLIDDLVEIYFAHVHPWIPILHVRHFRQDMRDKTRRPQLKTIFQAIVSLCARLSNDPRLHGQVEYWSKKCRQAVILESIDNFSVRNVQALVIVAFDTIGGGRGPSSWSIVGSMTRTVEQLQLSVENSEGPELDSEYFIRRLAFLKPPQSWIESEERRRIFWIVFALDRFCSVTTGWNTSLTSVDVRRRLPCEGAIWEAGTPVQTPFFGIADQQGTDNGPTPGSQRKVANIQELNSIGGLAFSLESTENLNLVSRFFLQPPINLTKKDEVQGWIMRFKELDLRLVQWKHFLPHKWKNASTAAPDGLLDPNLVLAHLTHSTSVILLHQGVAYPSPQWQAWLEILPSTLSAPSSVSADTCIASANEISSLAETFLQGRDSLTHPQFAFCLFVASRAVLAHSQYHNSPLLPIFWSMVASLETIGERWKGLHGSTQQNLASRFASRLSAAQAAHATNSDKPDPDTLDIRDSVFQEGHDNATNQAPVLQYMQGGLDSLAQRSEYMPMINEQSPSNDSVTLAFPPFPFSFGHFTPSAYLHFNPGNPDGNAEVGTGI